MHFDKLVRFRFRRTKDDQTKMATFRKLHLARDTMVKCSMYAQLAAVPSNFQLLCIRNITATSTRRYRPRVVVPTNYSGRDDCRLEKYSPLQNTARICIVVIFRQFSYRSRQAYFPSSNSVSFGYDLQKNIRY